MESRYATLVANTVSTVTLPSDWDAIEVISLNGAAEVYFTINGINPTVRGNNTYVLPSAIGGLEVPPETTGQVVVKLISPGTPSVYVRGIR